MIIRLFTLCLLLSLSALTYAAPSRVSGRVVNESLHHPAANATVELMRPRDGNTPIATTQTDSQGNFSFDVKDVQEKDVLLVRSRWKDFNYVAPAYDGSGQLGEAGAKLDPQQVRLAVYDTTTEMVPLNFMAHHLAIESRAGGLSCVERIVVENPTRKTFLGLGDRRATILLSLPEGAKNVRLDEIVTDAKLEERPDGWAVIKAIPPAVYDPRVLVVINYEMDWPSNLPWERELDFTRKVQYPTKFFFVARTSEDEKLEVEAPKLSPDQSAPLNIAGEMETRIVNAVGNPGHAPGAEQTPVLQPGDDLELKVAAPVNPMFWGFLGFTLLLCLAVPVALWRRRTPVNDELSHDPDKMSEPPVAGNVNGGTLAPGAISLGDNRSRDLIEQIAALDEAYERGDVAREKYSAQRTAWKNALVEQLLQHQT